MDQSGCQTHTYTFTPDQVGQFFCRIGFAELNVIILDSGDSRLPTSRAKAFDIKGCQLSDERLRSDSSQDCARCCQSIVEHGNATKALHGSSAGDGFAGFITRTIGRKTFNGLLFHCDRNAILLALLLSSLHAQHRDKPHQHFPIFRRDPR